MLNPYTDEQLLNVSLTDTKAGTMNIRYELCKEDTCVAKSDRIIVAPGNIDTINIDFPYDRVLAGAEMPIVVTAVDQFGNAIGEQIERFQVTVSNGTINGRNQPQEFTHFGRTTVLYKSDANDAAGTITVNVTPITDTSLPSASATFQKVKGTLTMSSGNTNITNLSYKLPDTYNAIRFVTVGGMQDINT